MPTESRVHAARMLHAVFGQGSRVPDTWDADLESGDAIFAQAVLGLCLRRWGRLQAHIRVKLADPERGLPLGTQVCMALGLAQLAWLPGVSDHAAVNEAVELVSDRTLGFPPHKGLVNAVLRAAARSREGLKADLEALPAGLDRTPFAERALLEALRPRGQERRIEELWSRLQEPPHPAFRAVKAATLPEGVEPDPALPGALKLAPGAPFPRQWLADGVGMVQDLSSQALMTFRWDRPVGRIADLCAAPGGKTTSLALRWSDAELFAVEQHPRRARRLAENLHARGIRARVVVADAVEWLRTCDTTFDLILVDAPCSGSGTLGKHPELTWIGDAVDLSRMRALQRSLVDAALPRLAAGGLLVYSVCSWLPEEGAAHLPSVLADHPGFAHAQVWPDPFQTTGGLFLPDPLAWSGEGFQGFALTRER